jgi:hypothetical protein
MVRFKLRLPAVPLPVVALLLAFEFPLFWSSREKPLLGAFPLEA